MLTYWKFIHVWLALGQTTRCESGKAKIGVYHSVPDASISTVVPLNFE